MKGRSYLSYGIGTIEAICFCIILLFTSVEAVLYWTPGYFEREYQKYHVTQAVDMDMPELLYVTEEMMDYLRDERADLTIVTKIAGRNREFFNTREKAHMVDVKSLFLKGIFLRRVCLLLLLLCIFVTWRKALPKRAKMLAYRNFTFFIIGLAAVLCFGISINFTEAFIQFHQLFFSNDLWILDPKTDLLIQIVPEPFFVDTAVRIGSLCFFGIAGVFLYSIVWIRREKKEKKVR